jgi:2-iminobutanoate/2-iminopropanoate deaminase
VSRVVETAGAPAPIGPYSQAIEAGGMVFCAGQIGLDPVTGTLVSGGAAAEAERAIRNIEAVLQAVGLGLGDVVKTTLFLTDLGDGPDVGRVYGRLMPTPHPARSTVQVVALPAGARVALEAVAVRAG